MAQILKFQNGNKTPAKYGSYTRDGKQVEVDDDYIDGLISFAKSQTDDPRVLSQVNHIVEALRTGKVHNFDTLSNAMTWSGEFDGSALQNKRRQHHRTRLGQTFGNI